VGNSVFQHRRRGDRSLDLRHHFIDRHVHFRTSSFSCVGREPCPEAATAACLIVPQICFPKPPPVHPPEAQYGAGWR
jgi:hypothetical protein